MTKIYTARNGARYIKLANGRCQFVSCNQDGAGKCSLCGSKGTSKTTCPLNPKAKKPNSSKHPNARRAAAGAGVGAGAPKRKTTESKFKNLRITNKSAHKTFLIKHGFESTLIKRITLKHNKTLNLHLPEGEYFITPTYGSFEGDFHTNKRLIITEITINTSDISITYDTME